MRKICWWLGTDSLTLIKNPPGRWMWHIKLIFYRLKWRIIHKFFDEHWSVHENLNFYLKKFGIKSKIIVDPAIYPGSCKKTAHKNFNILYYRPRPVNLGGQKYIDWYYGYDIYKKVKEFYAKQSDIVFIETSGILDMSNIYPIVDCYIRPNHWDGMPRMVLECQQKDIPYYWNNKINGEGYLSPSFNEVIKFINDEYSQWKENKKVY